MSPNSPAASLASMAAGALILATGSAAEAQMLPGLETGGEAYIASYEFDGGTTTLGIVDLDAVYTLPDMPLFFGIGIDYLYDIDEDAVQFDDYRALIGYDFGNGRISIGMPASAAESILPETFPGFAEALSLETSLNIGPPSHPIRFLEEDHAYGVLYERAVGDTQFAASLHQVPVFGPGGDDMALLFSVAGSYRFDTGTAYAAIESGSDVVTDAVPYVIIGGSYSPIEALTIEASLRSAILFQSGRGGVSLGAEYAVNDALTLGAGYVAGLDNGSIDTDLFSIAADYEFANGVFVAAAAADSQSAGQSVGIEAGLRF